MTERDHVPVRRSRTGTALREPVPQALGSAENVLPGIDAEGSREDGRHCSGLDMPGRM